MYITLFTRNGDHMYQEACGQCLLLFRVVSMPRSRHAFLHALPTSVSFIGLSYVNMPITFFFKKSPSVAGVGSGGGKEWLQDLWQGQYWGKLLCRCFDAAADTETKHGESFCSAARELEVLSLYSLVPVLLQGCVLKQRRTKMGGEFWQGQLVVQG